MRLIFDFLPAFGRQPIQRAKKRMAQTLLEQTQDRIEHGGDDEYTFPPLDFPRVDGTTDKPLFDSGQHLLNSLSWGMDDKSFWVGSNFIGAAVQQIGMKKKGGELPPTKPVHADALFLPLSRRGSQSVLQFGVTMSERRRVAMVKRKGKRVALTLQQRGGEEIDRKKGAKVKEGTKPDFMFVQEVNIRPRHYLRLSGANRRELVKVGFGN